MVNVERVHFFTLRSAPLGPRPTPLRSGQNYRSLAPLRSETAPLHITAHQTLEAPPVGPTQLSKLLDVSPLDTVNDCVLRSAEIFRLSPPSLQLWVRTKKGEAAYPLIGHEYPFAIERVCRQDIPDDSNQRCHYFLRNRHSRGDLPDAFSPKSPSPNFSSKQTGSSSGIQKFSTSKSPLRLHKMIMKSLTKLDVDSLDSPLPPPVPPPQAFLFGRDLCDVCGPSGQLPQPVMITLYFKTITHQPSIHYMVAAVQTKAGAQPKAGVQSKAVDQSKAVAQSKSVAQLKSGAQEKGQIEVVGP
ncbi:unnamed protein product, partial [Cyprideis torosa]